MTEESFSTRIVDGIAHIRLTRSDQFNSLTPSFWRNFPVAINEISETAAARVIVLSAEGKHFCSGIDVGCFMRDDFRDRPENPQVAAEAFRFLIKSLQDSVSALENARQPVLAAMQGGVIGAGLDLATAADCRYATEEAFFCLKETEIGMTADLGTFPRLARIIPEGWARQMAYTAERLQADRAKALGLVNEVYPTHDAMLSGVMTIAQKIAEHSPLAVTGSKRLLNYGRDHSVADTLDYVSVWNAAMLRADDLMEYFAATGEKRSPAFEDLRPVPKC
ncbi:MAG: enoyl-CoA hydratase-related protein [Parvularcula sp.]